MACSVKCLQYKPEELSSDHQHPRKKVGMAARTYIPSAERQRQEDVWGLWASQSSQIGELQAQ